jgi:hypothetical protein
LSHAASDTSTTPLRLGNADPSNYAMVWAYVRMADRLATTVGGHIRHLSGSSVI